MTYCIGVMLEQGIIFASDSRTNAGMDNVAKFCKMTLFERRGDRVIVLLSSGNLAGTQAVIGVLNQRCAGGDAVPSLWNARTMFDVAMLVADAMRDIERRDGQYLAGERGGFNASFIVGGQIKDEPPRLFRIYAEGNFIEAEEATPYFQTGETKYGKPIIDRVITRHTPLADAAKCVLVSFDLTMRSNLSVGHADRSHLLRAGHARSADAAPVRPRRRLFHRAEPRLERRHAERVPPAARARLVTTKSATMKIRVGFEMVYDCPQPTPMIFNRQRAFHARIRSRRPRRSAVRSAGADGRAIATASATGARASWRRRDACAFRADAVVNDTGVADPIVPEARQLPVENLPEETLLFLLGSRYCETDRLSETAWKLFGRTPPGWARVQAICDFVHRHIAFGYEHARMTRTRAGGVSRQDRRVPRLRPSRRGVLPMHEHSGPVLHGLPGRHRRSSAARHAGLRRVVRGFSRRALVHLRPAQ